MECFVFLATVMMMLVKVDSLVMRKALSDRSKGIKEILRSSLVTELGMNEVPDMAKANVSMLETVVMMSVYQQSIRQTEMARRLREEVETFTNIRVREREVKPSELASKITWNMNREERGTIIRFKIEQEASLSLVLSATLSLELVQDGPLDSSQVSVVQIVEGQGDAGITLNTLVVNPSSMNSPVKLDVTEAVQAWLEDPESNMGLLVKTGPGLVVKGEESVINMETKEVRGVRRHKRSFLRRHKEGRKEGMMGGTNCKKGDNRCCREDMVVNLKELKGFDFIFEPKEFNAHLCQGKCMPHYLPLNDHSLLQSLMHLKTTGGGHRGRKVKRPCCVPAKYDSLPILHLDEDNPTKLKVTNWKNIIVTECACG